MGRESQNPHPLNRRVRHPAAIFSNIANERNRGANSAFAPFLYCALRRAFQEKAEFAAGSYFSLRQDVVGCEWQSVRTDATKIVMVCADALIVVVFGRAEKLNVCGIKYKYH